MTERGPGVCQDELAVACFPGLRMQLGQVTDEDALKYSGTDAGLGTRGDRAAISVAVIVFVQDSVDNPRLIGGRSGPFSRSWHHINRRLDKGIRYFLCRAQVGPVAGQPGEIGQSAEYHTLIVGPNAFRVIVHAPAIR